MLIYRCTWVQPVVGIQRASRESFISHIGLLRLFQLTEQFQQVTPVVLLLPVEWLMKNRHPKSTISLNGLLLGKNNRSIAGFGSRLLATKGQSFPTLNPGIPGKWGSHGPSESRRCTFPSKHINVQGFMLNWLDAHDDHDVDKLV